MKRLLLLTVWMISITIRLSGNVIFPQAYISEFYIDSSGNWMLEVYFPGYPDVLIDSVYIETLTGSSKITGTYRFIEDSINYAVITEDSLVTPLEINPDSDCITIITYIDNYKLSYSEYDQLGLGSYHSRIPYIPEDHSIAKIYGYSNGIGMEEFPIYTLDNSPTIGEENTTDGTEGTVTGYLYDADHNPMPFREVLGYAGSVRTDENGYYCGKTLSMRYGFDTTTEFGEWDTYIYEPAELFVLPDSTYVLDLTVFDMWRYSDITEIPAEKIMITNYPNPFINGTTFYISIPSDTGFSVASLEIIDNSGKPVVSVPVAAHKSEITLPVSAANLPPGMYHYYLKIEGKITTKTMSLIKL